MDFGNIFLPGLNGTQAGDIRIWPTLNVGYKRSLSTSIWTSHRPRCSTRSSYSLSMEAFLTRIHWTRRSSLRTWRLAHSAWMHRYAACGLFGSVSANIPRTVRIEASQGPGIECCHPNRGVGRDQGFNGPNMSSVDGTTLIGRLGGSGIRFDRISVRFSDPSLCRL